MAALYSLEPEDRAEVERELAAARDFHEKVTANLHAHERNHAPKSYIGKLRAQLRSNARHRERLERLLEGTA